MERGQLKGATIKPTSSSSWAIVCIVALGSSTGMGFPLLGVILGQVFYFNFFIIKKIKT